MTDRKDAKRTSIKRLTHVEIADHRDGGSWRFGDMLCSASDGG